MVLLGQKNVTTESGKSYFNPRISSAEQSIIVHNFAKVSSDGKILPDKYWDKVGLDIPNSCAILVLVLSQVSISSLNRSLICFPKSFILILY